MLFFSVLWPNLFISDCKLLVILRRTLNKMCQLNCTQSGKKNTPKKTTPQQQKKQRKKTSSQPDLAVRGDDYYSSSLANFPFVSSCFPQSLTVTIHSEGRMALIELSVLARSPQFCLETGRTGCNRTLPPKFCPPGCPFFTWKHFLGSPPLPFVLVRICFENKTKHLKWQFWSFPLAKLFLFQMINKRNNKKKSKLAQKSWFEAALTCLQRCSEGWSLSALEIVWESWNVHTV